MAGGKGKSIGGKGSGAKESAVKSQKSHSAKAGLQVRLPSEPLGAICASNSTAATQSLHHFSTRRIDSLDASRS